MEVQKNRNRREKETIYQTIQEIPSNPKEPWDLEMDYDDTLTPVIPIEQSPDADGTEPGVASNHGVNNAATNVTPDHGANCSVSTLQVGNPSTAEPDLELLAVLLKNPELVFALTSGQAGNLSSEDTVKLLDMIKAGGAGSSASSFNGINKQVEEKVEVSLPSPTPPSNPGTVRHFGLCATFAGYNITCIASFHRQYGLLTAKPLFVLNMMVFLFSFFFPLLFFEWEGMNGVRSTKKKERKKKEKYWILVGGSPLYINGMLHFFCL